MGLIDTYPQIILITGALLVTAVIYWVWSHRARKEEQEVLATLEDMATLGEIVPDTIHPVIDLDRCIGSGACVLACPEKQVLGIVGGQAKLVNALACVGHSACVSACPVEAIKLVFGTAQRGVDLPLLDPNFQTTRPGVYVVGELGGMGLIRNAVRQGRQAADHVVSGGRRGKTDAYDAAVVGAGPAGVSATLRLMEAGRRVVLLERDKVGGTIMHYPRAKVVMDRRGHREVCRRGGRRFHIGDDVGRGDVARFAQMHFVARPFGVALLAVARFRVIRRADEQGRRRQVVGVPPAHRALVHGGIELLHPDLPQGLDGGHLAQPRRGTRGIDRREQLEPIRAHALG